MTFKICWDIDATLKTWKYANKYPLTFCLASPLYFHASELNLPSHTLLFSERSEDLAQGLTMQILLLFQGPTNNDKTKEYAFRLTLFKAYK